MFHTPRNEDRMTTLPPLLHATRLLGLIILTVILYWNGELPLLLACGEDSTVPEETMTLKNATRGSLLFTTSQAGRYRPAPILKTDVKIAVTGIIARTTLTQEFINPGRRPDDWAEGIYVFPLPDTAAVDHLRMKVGERTIVGEIKERDEAKRAYEEAKQEGKRASLVEQERPNIFTTSVANIAPGDRITVEIQYQETVTFDHGTFSLRFPMVVGPRYIAGTPVVMEDQPPGYGWSPNTDHVPDASRITTPVHHPRLGSINPVSLSIDLAAGFPVGTIESPYHKILTVEGPDGRRQITLRTDHVPADKDFQLKWRLAPGRTPTAALYRQCHAGHVYTMLMVSPPSSERPIPHVPREAIFVIDTSGSMAGTSIEQARAALLLALTRLTAEDRFNIIQFNNVTHVLFSQPKPVTPTNLRKAVHYVERLHANGGTEILPALKMALRGEAPSSHLRQIVFLTDGQVGNENELFDAIRSHLGTSRLFTIGIGSAPNSYFMRKAAEFGRGTFTHIGSASEVKDQMDLILRKLERPVLTDIRMEGLRDDGEMFPGKIADLYDGGPIVVAMKSRSFPDQLAIAGTIGSTPWSTTVDLTKTQDRDGLSVYWARQKIAELMDRQKHGHDEAATRQAVLDVALTHHLVSKYSSLVAIDAEPIRPTDKLLVTHAMKTNLPEGQDYQAIFGLPKTATNGPWHLLLGLIALTMSAFMWCYERQGR